MLLPHEETTAGHRLEITHETLGRPYPFLATLSRDGKMTDSANFGTAAEALAWGRQKARFADPIKRDLLVSLKALLFNARHGNGLEAQWQALDAAEAAIAAAEAEETP